MADARDINFDWLLRLRWGVVVGQTVVLLLARLLLDVELPLLPLLAIIAVEAVSNAFCWRWARRTPTAGIADWMLGALMALDIATFTLILWLTGGPVNPFSFLYLVYIALAAVVLPGTWGWALSGFALACFGLLFAISPLPGGSEHASHLRSHLQGMWVAFALAAALILYFVQRVTGALAARERELARAREHGARSERLASLATLAAGAAHQLATPLSTIAVVSGELEGQLERLDGSTDAVADARLIREQVERCREILLQMAADAGESTGEPLVQVQAAALVRQALSGLPDAARVVVRDDGVDSMLVTPARSLAQAIRAVVKNAIDAAPGTTAIDVDLADEGSHLRISVRDRGVGMTADVLGRVGEPFYTTKPPDRGMGLGLFLSRTVVEQLGGELRIDSTPGEGTTVAIVLPRRGPATIHRIAAQGPAATRGA